MEQPLLGQKILQLRNELGFTQEELVEKCNISVRTLQRIEAGDVTPRRYTIRALLDAMNRDMDDLRPAERLEEKVKQAVGYTLDKSQDVTSVLSKLQIAWIAGIVSMVAFIFQAIDDSNYVIYGDLFFSKWIYTLVGNVSIIAFALHMRGFAIIGNLFKNNLLRVSALLLIGAHILITAYAVADVHLDFLPDEVYLILFCVLYGATYLVFGIGLLKDKVLGSLTKATGIIQIVLGAMFLTFIMAIVAGPASIIVQGLNVAILLQAISVIKKQMEE